MIVDIVTAPRLYHSNIYYASPLSLPMLYAGHWQLAICRSDMNAYEPEEAHKILENNLSEPYSVGKIFCRNRILSEPYLVGTVFCWKNI